MEARSGGGLIQPLGTGEVGGAIDAAVGFGGADAVGATGPPEAATPASRVAGAAVGAATEHPIKRSVATTRTVKPRFIEVDLEVQSLIAGRESATADPGVS
jgi:hypothetical protein